MILIPGLKYPVSATLMQVIMNYNNAPKFEGEKLISIINESMTHYVDEINESRKRGYSNEEIILGYYELFNEIWKNLNHETISGISCKKGCSFCCHINVDIHEVEAKVIFNYLGENGRFKKIDWNKLENQKGLGTYERPKIKDSACIFLESNGTCGIYDVRPISCRKFFVVSSAEKCNTKIYGEGDLIQIQAILEMEILASVLANVFPKIGLMANIMIKLRDEFQV